MNKNVDPISGALEALCKHRVNLAADEQRVKEAEARLAMRVEALNNQLAKCLSAERSLTELLVNKADETGYTYSFTDQQIAAATDKLEEILANAIIYDGNMKSAAKQILAATQNLGCLLAATTK